MDKGLARQSRRFYEQLYRPALRAPSLFQLMGFRMGRMCVRQALTEGDRDFDYYRDRGWFDSAYYFPVELGPFKRTIGAVFDWMFARIFRPDAAPRRSHGS